MQLAEIKSADVTRDRRLSRHLAIDCAARSVDDGANEQLSNCIKWLMAQIHLSREI